LEVRLSDINLDQALHIQIADEKNLLKDELELRELIYQTKVATFELKNAVDTKFTPDASIDLNPFQRGDVMVLVGIIQPMKKSDLLEVAKILLIEKFQQQNITLGHLQQLIKLE
jgi:hypothetical protein